MRSTVTMNDIAAKAGVSQATVSFVLNNRREGINIPQTTRQRVMDAASDLGYRRNQLARAMVTGKSRILGILTVHQSGENIVRVLAGVLDAANKHDYLVKVLHLSDVEVNDSTLARCQEWKLAGAIVVGMSETSLNYLYNEFQRTEIPAALVDNTPRRETGFRALSDDAQGIRDVFTHLYYLGHRRIAFLGGRPSFITYWREQCFRTLLTEYGLSVPETWIQHSSWGDKKVIENVSREILTAPERPSAIISASDQGAMVIISQARAMGLRLPEDPSVTGYSNATLSAFADPSLTTVDQGFHGMGQAAAQYLIEQSEKSEVAPPFTEVLLPTRLIVRDSTGPYTESKV